MEDPEIVMLDDGNEDPMEVDHDEDPTVCDICLSGEVFENNEILFCDKCNVAVHQLCYAVRDIPDGPWFCYPCAEGANPHTLTCELCPFTGGAYKHAHIPGKWVHPICANWIPEVFEEVGPNREPLWISLRFLDPKRFKLKCAICQKKGGACVQCSHGRCSTAVHARCALREKSAGYTKRIVKVSEKASNWEIFCKAHASSVSDPVKPKKKSSLLASPAPFSPSPTPSVTEESRPKKDKPLSFAPVKEPKTSLSWPIPPSSSSALPPAPKSTHKSKAASTHKKERDRDRDSLLNPLLWTGSGYIKPPLPIPAVVEDDSPKESDSDDEYMREEQSDASFPVLSLSDWPGIGEGEGLSTEHFWNYISGFFPEDHSKHWLEFMMSMALHPKDWSLETDPVMAASVPATSERELEAHLDETNESFRTDKDMRFALLAPRRQEFLDSLQAIVLTLNKELAQRAQCLQRAGLRFDAFAVEEELLLREVSLVPDNSLSQHNLAQTLSYTHIHNGKDSSSRADAQSDQVSLRVIFDAAQGRYCADFVVRFPVRESDAHALPRIPVHCAPEEVEETIEGMDEKRETEEEALEYAKWHLVDLSAHREGEKERDMAALFESLILQTGMLMARVQQQQQQGEIMCMQADEESEPQQFQEASVIAEETQEQKETFTDGETQSDELFAAVALQRWALMDDDASPLLAVRSSSSHTFLKAQNVHTQTAQNESLAVVRVPSKSAVDSDELSRLILTDQKAFALLANSLYAHTASIATLCRGASDTLRRARHESERSLECKYQRQQVWKRVARCLSRGLRDQRPDFNKVEAAALPASWAIGRAAPTVEEEEKENEAVQEDAVCMCCFDGSSDDSNKILFCDGCNAALHQFCFGVSEVPEGDYFCDRCLAVQQAVHTIDTEVEELRGCNLSREEKEEVAEEQFDIKGSITCCLCPVTHGGLKRVRNKHCVSDWAHLSCVLWANESTHIGDLTEMKEIDISALEFVPLSAPPSSSSSTLTQRRLSISLAANPNPSAQASAQTSNGTGVDVSQRCVVCGWGGGLLRRCCGTDAVREIDVETGAEREAERVCELRMHPLCAWFAGYAVSASLTDESFLGVDRGGKYPSGVAFSLRCERHSDELRVMRERERLRTTSGAMTSVSPSLSLAQQVVSWEETQRALVVRNEQRALRAKYRIVEKDLERFPVAASGRRRRRKRRERETQRKLGSAAERAREREKENESLQEDVYAETQCALCMAAVSVRDVFGARYESEEMARELPRLSLPSELSVGVSEGETRESERETANATSLESPWVPVRCVVCGITAHTDCVQRYLPHTLSAPLASQTQKQTQRWQCEVCCFVVNNSSVSASSSSSAAATMPSTERPRDCALCPRRGGVLRRTTDGRWVHPLCVQFAPHTLAHFAPSVSVALSAAGTDAAATDSAGALCGLCGPVELCGSLDKAVKRHKCTVCNRRQGLALACCAPGCTVQVHPLCALRTSSCLVAARHGVLVFCAQHMPAGVERLARCGRWADALEVQHLRVSLERARLIADLLVRRDKHKRAIARIEGESALHKAVRLLRDRERDSVCDNSDEEMETDEPHPVSPALSALLKEFGVSPSVLEESEGEPDSDDSDEDEDEKPPQRPEDDEFVCINDVWVSPSAAPLLVSLHGEKRSIGVHWQKRRAPAAPRSLLVSFAGVEVAQKDASRGNEKDFTKKILSRINEVKDASRATTQIFSSAKKEAAFAKELVPWLQELMAMKETDFVAVAREAGVDIAIKRAPRMSRIERIEGESARDRELRLKRERQREVRERAAREREETKEREARRGKEGEIQEGVEVQADEKAPPGTARKRARRDRSPSPDKARESERLSAEERESNVIADKRERERDRKRSRRAEESRREREREKAPSSWLEAAQNEHDRLSNVFSRDWLRFIPEHCLPETEKGKETEGTEAEVKREKGKERESGRKRDRERAKKRSSSVSSSAPPLHPLLAASALISKHVSLAEWTPYPPDEVFKIERVMQSVLNALTQHDLEESSSSSAARSAKKQRSGSSSSSSSRRTIEDDFLNAPIEEVPDYCESVRRVVDLSAIRKRLHLHGYWSLGEFTLDFITMLNNARAVTSPDSQVWKDTEIFAKLFDEFKAQAIDNPHQLSAHSSEGWRLSVTRCEDEDDSSPCVFPVPRPPSNKKKVSVQPLDLSLFCGGCRTKFSVSPWPSTFEVPGESASLLPKSAAANGTSAKGRRGTRHSMSTDKRRAAADKLDAQWQWLCGDCISSCGDNLTGCEVRVWWHDDECAYEGKIDAFDNASLCHRVLYGDNEWEFVPFAQEVFLLRPHSQEE